MKQGYSAFFVPAENAYELEYIPHAKVYPLHHIQDVANYVLHADESGLVQAQTKEFSHFSSVPFSTTFSQVKGHLAPKRALSIAVAGFHNVLMVGAP